MAKEKKKERKMNFSLTPFLYGGFIVVCVTALLQSFIPAFPAAGAGHPGGVLVGRSRLAAGK